MIFRYKRIFLFLNIIVAFLFSASFGLKAQKTNFTLVLDAGHGGHDPGAIGAISREKDINLGVVLRLGELVESNFKDVKVVLHPQTDNI
jgi:N-acetylmuramoyl-L-alanine amidase